MTLEFQQLGLAPDFIDYTRGWDIQRELHEKVLAGTAPSTVLLLEHSAVYTAGKRTEDHERPFDGTPVVAVDRGGKLTWHGPGQLVGYPIIKLKNKARHPRLRGAAGGRHHRRPGRLRHRRPSGSRAAPASGSSRTTKGPDRKIAAIGIRVHEGVTMHGFAINCNNDLAPYAQIIACGITDAGVTTIAREPGRDVTPADLVARIIEELRNNEEALVATPEGALL